MKNVKMEWIPIKMRPGTDEEYEEFSQYGDCPREDFRVFDCQMPDDDQEVLVSTRWGNVCIDVWHNDVDCCYFEDYSDDDEVLAWMPLPDPYKDPLDHSDEDIRCKAEGCSPEGCKHCDHYEPIDFGGDDHETD